MEMYPTLPQQLDNMSMYDIDRYTADIGRALEDFIIIDEYNHSGVAIKLILLKYIIPCARVYQVYHDHKVKDLGRYQFSNDDTLLMDKRQFGICLKQRYPLLEKIRSRPGNRSSLKISHYRGIVHPYFSKYRPRFITGRVSAQEQMEWDLKTADIKNNMHTFVEKREW